MLTLLDMSYDMPDPWCANIRPEILRSAVAKRKQMNNLFFMLASAGTSLRGNPYFDSLYISQDLACQLLISLLSLLSIRPHGIRNVAQDYLFCSVAMVLALEHSSAMSR